jgi:hypothetical protein
MSVLGHGFIVIRLTDTAGLTVRVTDEMTKAATGLTIEQIGMLRAVYEDTWGEDPACLTPKELSEHATAGRKSTKVRTWAKRAARVDRRSPARRHL